MQPFRCLPVVISPPGRSAARPLALKPLPLKPPAFKPLALQLLRPRSLALKLLPLPSRLPLAALAALLTAGAAVAIPRLDLTPYPQPGRGERRWLIQPPGVLPPIADAGLSPHPSDWRLELIVGRELRVDCNGPRLSGRLQRVLLPGSRLPILRLIETGPPIYTRMACPADPPARRAFVAIGNEPFLLPYRVSPPIVIYAPSELQVRWRLWKAERLPRQAQPL